MRVPVWTAGDLDAALESARREHADGLVVHPDVLIGPHRRRIAEFALRHRLPAIEPFGALPDAGGLMSYGSNLTDMSRRAAEQTDSS